MTYRIKCGRGWFTIWYSKRAKCWYIARYGTSIPRPTVIVKRCINVGGVEQ